MSKLNTYVPVQDPAGQTHLLGPHSVIPEWAETAIKNPDVWDEAPTAAPAEDAGAGDAGGQAAADGAPELPKPAPNANAEKWLAYATAAGIEVPEKDHGDRDVIKALVKAADTEE